MSIAYLHWDPQAELFTVPLLGIPIFWYGVFFAIGFWLGFLVFVQMLVRYFRTIPSLQSMSASALREKAQKLTDRLTMYIVIATLIGARLGHFLFYEQPSEYLADPLEIFRIRNGGLASHGAVIAILLAVFLFCRRFRHQVPKLTWVCILDLLTPSAAIVACLIRIGNFFNQEILGTPSTLPWAVVFGHPADYSFPEPRHPVQLYEAIGYLAIFCLLWHLSKRASILRDRGKLVGILLVLVFSFRFLMEFFKTEQSHLLSSSYFTMGQILSIPLIILGFVFMGWNGLKKIIYRT